MQPAIKKKKQLRAKKNHLCSIQRCSLRGAHDLHLCMRCERRPGTDGLRETTRRDELLFLTAGSYLGLPDAGIFTAMWQ